MITADDLYSQDMEAIKAQAKPLVEVIDMIAKIFEPKDYSFNLVSYAYWEGRYGDQSEEIVLRFEIIEQDGYFHWQHTEFGMEPQQGELHETPFEAYCDAVAYTDNYATEHSEEMQERSARRWS